MCLANPLLGDPATFKNINFLWLCLCLCFLDRTSPRDTIHNLGDDVNESKSHLVLFANTLVEPAFFLFAGMAPVCLWYGTCQQSLQMTF